MCDASAKPARFTVSGSSGIVAVSVPSSVQLLGPDGNSISIRPLLSESQIALTGDAADVFVGGVLTLGAFQAPGNYSGSYNILFEYQ